jgi:hypothetical protein
MFAEAGEMAPDLVGDAGRDRGRLDDVADPRTDRANAFGVTGADLGQLLQGRATSSSLRATAFA